MTRTEERLQKKRRVSRKKGIEIEHNNCVYFTRSFILAHTYYKYHIKVDYNRGIGRANTISLVILS